MTKDFESKSMYNMHIFSSALSSQKFGQFCMLGKIFAD